MALEIKGKHPTNCPDKCPVCGSKVLEFRQAAFIRYECGSQFIFEEATENWRFEPADKCREQANEIYGAAGQKPATEPLRIPIVGTTENPAATAAAIREAMNQPATGMEYHHDTNDMGLGGNPNAADPVTQMQPAAGWTLHPGPQQIPVEQAIYDTLRRSMKEYIQNPQANANAYMHMALAVADMLRTGKIPDPNA